jgi:hypothetical protein
MATKCEHMNEDDTFKGGFDGCVLHMMNCEGHSEESAKKICGAIAQRVGASAPSSILHPPSSILHPPPPLRARILTEAPTAASSLGAGDIIEFMALPAGTHTCNFGQGGARVERTIRIDAEAARALDEQLKAVNARSQQRAFLDFDHADAGPAAAWPVGYLWRESPAPGVYVRAELSQAGAQAITGCNYRAFSPVFYATQPPDPAAIRCEPNADLNFGGLVNEPAFHDITPLWAKDQATGGASGKTGDGENGKVGDGEAYKGESGIGTGGGGAHHEASRVAHRASAEADDAEGHERAAKAHERAADLHEAQGNHEVAGYHRAMAAYHHHCAAGPVQARDHHHSTLDTRHPPGAAAPDASISEPRGSDAAGARSSEQNQDTHRMNDTELAALQAKSTKLERENSALLARAEKAEKDGKVASDALAARRRADAQAAITAAIKRGAIPAKDEALQARWQKLLEEDPDNLALLTAEPENLALGPSLTRGPAAPAASSLAPSHGARASSLIAQEGPARVLSAYAALAARNSAIRDLSPGGFAQKGQHARDMAALFAREIAPRWSDFRDLPLTADANLGTLSGTLVAQRTLQLFKLEFPVISKIFTDFSDTPAQFRQTEATRIVIVPAVQSYNTNPDATGRPLGWNTVLPAQTKDVLITLDEHVGVPIVFDANTLASTMRRLFDEQAPAAAYALAKYFVEKIYRLFTPANYNAYATKNPPKVPAAYAYYPVAIGDFARSTLTKLAAILNPNEVPIQDRVCLLTSPYFEQLATDPSLVTFFAGQQAPEIVTANRLPKLANFEPIEAPNLTAPATYVPPGGTQAQPPAGWNANLVGMVLHKAGVVAKTRLSNDYTQALPGSSYGSVTTITDPDIGISVVLVQYVNHTGGYAEWRIQVMLGAAVGDPRGGLCITSQ